MERLEGRGCDDWERRGTIYDSKFILSKCIGKPEFMTYGNTDVATDDGDNDVLGQGEIAKDLSNESGSANDIEGGDTEEANNVKL